ncbi:MAG: hypothetical protein J0H15_06295 [Xanthomonadales bacterium]|nr:hypothetical protein [Xanthomonadales bacterium]
MRRSVLRNHFFETTILVVLVLAAGPVGAAICRVTPAGAAAAEGASWATPTTLQAALGRLACTELWLAAGVYVPSAAGDRAASFRVERNLALYGGFAGIEGAREERDPAIHRSVLSGDIDDNDIRDGDGVTLDAEDIVGANSYHVLVVDGTTVSGPIGPETVLDGLTISAGAADSTYPHNSGAGMYCNGAWLNARCEPTLSDLRFMGNRAAAYGGALFLQADTSGSGASPALGDVLFSGNLAGRWGGAIYVKANVGSSASPVIERATFTANRADQGGAIYNSAGAQGGIAAMSLVNVTFDGNDASIGDAYSGNGGAIHNEGVGGEAHISLRHVTVSDNTALGLNHFGGALVNRGARAKITIDGSILWGNVASARAQVYNTGGSVEIGASLVEGGCPVAVACTELVDGDPRLAPLGDNGAHTPTRLPARHGAAVDAGVAAGCPATDQRGVPRPQGAACDLGAVELVSRRCHVDHAATGAGDGADWADAYTDLQAALGDETCSEIWVARGVYKPVVPADAEHVTAAERSASFDIRPGTRLYGGFAGGEASLDESDPLANPTVLSGDIDGNDITDADGVVVHADGLAGANSFHVVWLDGTTARGPITGTTRLEGFIVTAGRADDGAGMDNTGGGLLCDGTGEGNACSPELRRLRFSGNGAGRGGALAIQARDAGVAEPSFRAVVFRGNAAAYGGAIHFDAYGSGGRVAPSIRDVGFIGNQATLEGGALNIVAGHEGAQVNLQLVNASFVGNDASRGGAIASRATYSATAAMDLRHATVAGNSADEGAAVWSDARDEAVVSVNLANSIVWGNDGPPTRNSADATVTLRASVLEGGCPASEGHDCSGVIDADPLLGPLAGDAGFAPALLPGAGSPAVDAGDAAYCVDADQRGVARPQGTECDMGAVEVRGPRLDVSVESAVGRATLTSPLALAGAIDCSAAEPDACSARFSSEEGAPEVLLASAPATHHVASVDADCAAVNDVAAQTVRVPVLAEDCELRLAWAPNRVGGEVQGLAGSGLVLHLDAGDGGSGELLAIDAAGAFSFDTAVAVGSEWAVTIAAAPGGPAQTCSVSAGSGTMAPGGASGVIVACETDRFPLGGSIAGLAGHGLRLSLHSGGALLEELAVPSGSGSFRFGAELIEGQDYAITVGAQPGGPAQTCVLEGSAAGTMPVGGIDALAVACTTNTYAIGGTVTGVGGPGLVLQLDGGESLAVGIDGPFQFATRVASGETYTVALLATPAYRSCTLAHATGTVGDADVHVEVACSEDPPELALTIDDGRDHARYGQVVDYIVELRNDGGTARGIELRFSLSAGFDGEHALWTCIGGGSGAACKQDAADPLRFIVTLPPERVLTWLASVPVRPDATAATVEFGVGASGAKPVLDVNTLVVLRSGFDRPYSDGTEGVAGGLEAQEFLAGQRTETVVVPDGLGRIPAVLRELRAVDGSVRVEAWRPGERVLVRLARHGGDGRERISPWAEADAGTTLLFGAAAVGEAMPPRLILEGAQPGLVLD